MIQEELTREKIQNIDGFDGMTVNERLYATGLLDEFYNVRQNNTIRAITILRMVKVDDISIKEILK